MKRTALFFASTAILFSSPSAMAEQSPLPRPFISSNTNDAPLLLTQAEIEPAAEEVKDQAPAPVEEAQNQPQQEAEPAARAQQQAEEQAKKRAEEEARAAEAKAAERAQEAKHAAQEEAQKAAEQQKAIEAEAKQKAAEEAQAAKAEKAAAQEAEQAKKATEAEANKAAEQQKAIEAEAKQKAAAEAQAAKTAEKAAAQEAEQAKKTTEAEANKAAEAQKATEAEARKKAESAQKAADQQTEKTAEDAKKAVKEAPAAAEQPAIEKPQQSKGQKPAVEQPAAEKPAPATEPATGEKPAKPVEGQKPAGEKPASAAEPATGEKPAKPVEGQKPVTGQPAGEQPAAGKPAGGKPAPVTEPATGEKPAQPIESQKPGTEPAAGQPTGEKPAVPVEAGKPGPKDNPPLPENAAPVLDSQKPAPPVKGTGGQVVGKPAAQQPVAQQPAVQTPATPPAPPPKNDAEVQRTLVPVKVEPIRTEEGTRVKQAPQAERPADVQVIKQIDNRTIVEVNNNVFVESSDRPRMSRDAQDVYYEDLPRNRTRETIVRDNGVQVVTIRNRYGDVIQRSRVMPDGREVLLSYTPDYDREERYQWRDPGLDLPPLVLDIPVSDYILDADQAPEEEVYDFFARPPVERVERIYSVDEVKRSARIRDKVRRIDLDTITFKFGSADISDDQIPHLDSVAKAMAQILQKNPAETFLIEGHTDAVGSDQANLVLSDKRAESVAQALTNVFGIPPENMATQGYGERYLKIKVDGPEQQNRRVAIRRITALVQPMASK
ncbi:OmpA family protein [Phyllobacterium myrsinacearum]|uniref:Outer membrane protein OmpA-like peptidoglycan-associated protein n=1 Tax=Phyllobacterium myrsinacearum TaxID=28101 RepID=A0A839ENL7_9HYPH|nr:OmpA family protein [Phyllobacterium myrsinacearum]MBA8880469.1 outer membrane protein OmpA-like peptidoglycan-associated protein [Phyllobacterium myrsinacearum]